MGNNTFVIAHGMNKWESRVLGILRLLALVGGAFEALIALLHILQNVPAIPPLPLPVAIRSELWFQAVIIFCLLGFVLQPVPQLQETKWFTAVTNTDRQIAETSFVVAVVSVAG